MATWVIFGLTMLMRVERLDHVRAVLAGQRHVRLEVVLTWQRGDLGERLLRSLARVPADLKQGQHERGELVPERDAKRSGTEMSVPGRVIANEGRAGPFRRSGR